MGVKEQIYNWYSVMTDPRMDGFNGWACKQKIYETKMLCEKLLQTDGCPTYHGEEEWLAEKLKEEL